jgi:NodT family efflux transporter outer membrane factor (OMF) lipoprotein
MRHQAQASGRKRFFFEKKNQKTFANWGSLYPETTKPKQVFCFFFSKKKSFLPCPIAACGTAMALAGCAVGPDFHKPAPPASASYSSSSVASKDDAQTFVQGMDIPGQWWTLFHSTQLDALVHKALDANPTLTSAQAALLQARENLYAQEGAFLPSLSATFEPTRNKTATRSVSFAAAKPVAYYNLITASLSVSYAPDIWGLNRRQVENLVAQTESQRFQLEAAYLTLTSNLVTATINEASLRAQIKATQQIIAAETDLLGVLKKQYDLGQVAEVDELAQQAALAQARATLPPLQKQLDQQRDALASLLGQPPDQLITERFVLDDIGLPRQLPVSVPAALVNQRPDIRQAEANLHAACANVGVAVANRLPLLNLTAEGGSQSNYFNQLFAHGNGFWTIAASITQPVFDGGMLLHKARAARAALEQAEATYRSTTLSAFQNVADSLAALQADADSVAAATTAEQSAQATLRIVRLQVSLGQVAYLGILNAQQTALQSELSLVQAKAARLADTAALFQALGGGWWHRDDVHIRDLRGNDPLEVVGVRSE